MNGAQVVPLAVENLSSISAHELHRTVHEVLQLPDVVLETCALWLVSPLVEVQLKLKHQPYKLGHQQPELLLHFTKASDDDVAMDEPSLQFRRGLRFQELSWDHTSPEEEEPVLWLEFDGDSEGTPINKLLRIYSKQIELMSGLIEYCIELTQAVESALPQESASGPQEAPSPSPPPTQRPKLLKLGSVVCSQIQHLSIIGYVEEGKGIKQVKPKCTTSVFSQQLSTSQGSYTMV
ncbi:FERM domain-containing protein 8 [Cricetulus griseus]|uniref:FERM domain-containing protein 8 n=1 Tax=Cricetulus griseus TaxID=10029 RepID=G3HQF9_CRIGR|nr:FERM domain-containing protein 8 [Cricetulus griseus]